MLPEVPPWDPALPGSGPSSSTLKRGPDDAAGARGRGGGARSRLSDCGPGTYMDFEHSVHAAIERRLVALGDSGKLAALHRGVRPHRLPLHRSSPSAGGAAPG